MTHQTQPPNWMAVKEFYQARAWAAGEEFDSWAAVKEYYAALNEFYSTTATGQAQKRPRPEDPEEEPHTRANKAMRTTQQEPAYQDPGHLEENHLEENQPPTYPEGRPPRGAPHG